MASDICVCLCVSVCVCVCTAVGVQLECAVCTVYMTARAFFYVDAQRTQAHVNFKGPQSDEAGYWGI